MVLSDSPSVQREVIATATVESASPKADNVANGIISVRSERGPVLAHTHRRLSSNDGIMPTKVAMMLASTASVARVATSVASTNWLTPVAIAETDA